MQCAAGQPEFSQSIVCFCLALHNSLVVLQLDLTPELLLPQEQEAA
jgi:hypothetical protein